MVPDPKCDYCRRGFSSLRRHSALKEAREMPILTFDCSSGQADVGDRVVFEGGAPIVGYGCG